MATTYSSITSYEVSEIKNALKYVLYDESLEEAENLSEEAKQNIIKNFEILSNRKSFVGYIDQAYNRNGYHVIFGNERVQTYLSHSGETYTRNVGADRYARDQIIQEKTCVSNLSNQTKNNSECSKEDKFLFDFLFTLISYDTFAFAHVDSEVKPFVISAQYYLREQNYRSHPEFIKM